jgi:hypothetical protein
MGAGTDQCATVQVDPSRTPNAVVCEYPRALNVFRRLGVELRYEGMDSLDEVAWRRGIRPDRLVALLRSVINA